MVLLTRDEVATTVPSSNSPTYRSTLEIVGKSARFSPSTFALYVLLFSPMVDPRLSISSNTRQSQGMTKSYFARQHTDVPFRSIADLQCSKPRAWNYISQQASSLWGFTAAGGGLMAGGAVAKAVHLMWQRGLLVKVPKSLRQYSTHRWNDQEWLTRKIRSEWRPPRTVTHLLKGPPLSAATNKPKKHQYDEPNAHTKHRFLYDALRRCSHRQ